MRCDENEKIVLRELQSSLMTNVCELSNARTLQSAPGVEDADTVEYLVNENSKWEFVRLSTKASQRHLRCR